MRTSHVICLILAILFTAGALVAGGSALSVCLTPPEQNDTGTPETPSDVIGGAIGEIATGCARGLAAGVFGVMAAILGAIGLIFSAVGWNAGPRGAKLAFRILLVLNVLSAVAGLLAPVLLKAGG